MIADEAREWTDEHLIEMENHLKQIYRQAHAELTEKWNAYMERGQSRLEGLYADYVSAPADQKAIALQKYQDAAQNYTLRNQWYRDMVTDTTYRLAHVNEIAIAYINGEIPSVYVHNYNQIDDDLKPLGIRWDIRNEEMTRNLILDSLPQKQLDYAKDMAWNSRQINSSVLQGIIQGESIPKIANRLLPIVDNNRVAAVRTARTMVTGAENRGRQDRYESYTDEGVIMSRIWLATPDGRTRAWHLSMDGQEVGVDEPFIDGHGNSLEYPGDPGGAPDSIYNCRCSMRSHITGFRSRSGKIYPVGEFEKVETLHSAQIQAERDRRMQAAQGE